MAEEEGEAEPESKSNSSDMAFDLVELLVAVSTEGMSLRAPFGSGFCVVFLAVFCVDLNFGLLGEVIMRWLETPSQHKKCC